MSLISHRTVPDFGPSSSREDVIMHSARPFGRAVLQLYGRRQVRDVGSAHGGGHRQFRERLWPELVLQEWAVHFHESRSLVMHSAGRNCQSPSRRRLQWPSRERRAATLPANDVG